MQTIPSPNNLRIVTHWHLTWRVANASFAHSLNVSSGSANNEESSARRFDVLPQTWSESCKKIWAAIDRFCASADNPGLVLCQGNLAGEQPLQKTLRVAVDESATVRCHVFKVWPQPMSCRSNVCSSMREVVVFELDMMKFHVVTAATDATTENSLPTTRFRPKLY